MRPSFNRWLRLPSPGELCAGRGAVAAAVVAGASVWLPACGPTVIVDGARAGAGDTVTGAGDTTAGAGAGSGAGASTNSSQGSGGSSSAAGSGSGGNGATSPIFPSCAGGGVGADHHCGPSHDDDCCASLLVEGGTFFRDYRDNQPELKAPATVSSFRLDRYEVTVGRFRAFVEAYPGSRPAPGAGVHPLIAGTGWDPAWDADLAETAAALRKAVACDPDGMYSFQTWTDEPTPSDDLPMGCLSWWEAFAFCAWDGGRLPTEAEWAYAAAGGAEQRYFPWAVPPTSLAIDPTYDVYECRGDGTPYVCTPADYRAVGSGSPKGDGRWGQSNLGGNVSEWVLDWFSTYSTPCNDCANVIMNPGDPSRSRRGGDFSDPVQALKPWIRAVSPPSSRRGYLGVRCAR